MVAWVSAFAAPSGLALQQGLGELQMPVAEDAPDEAIDARGGVVEAVGFDRAGRLRSRLRRLAQDPAVQRRARRRPDRSPRRARIRSSRRSARRSRAWCAKLR